MARKSSRIRAAFAPSGPLRPFRLLRSDFKGRFSLREYRSDWTFNHLVLASAVFVFFTNLLPGITFASDLYVQTGKNYGAIEVVFSTGLCGVIFGLFSAQPLTILGVTGPFCILSERIYSLCVHSFDIPFLPFMAWACIHSLWLHLLLAIFNAHDWSMIYVTHFSTEMFSLLNSLIYFHKAIQELDRAHANTSFAAFLYSVIGAVGTCIVAVTLSTAETWPVFSRWMRMGLREYAAAISIIIFILLPNVVPELKSLDSEHLPTSTSFTPTSPSRSVFFVRFWELPIQWIFAAIIPGAIITVLFFFDVEVSTICATLPRYGVRKNGGFAWDVMLLGISTAVCGILGIPPANGLLPQAPLHSESLRYQEVVEVEESSDDSEKTTLAEEPTEKDADIDTLRNRQRRSAAPSPSSASPMPKRFITVPRVYEQRWSHLLHALAILVFVSPPFMHLLGLTPTSVLAGLFMFMGEQSLATNPILYRVFAMLTPRASERSELETEGGGEMAKGAHFWGWRGTATYTILQILFTVGIFAMTLTVAAPAFPVVIVGLVPVRLGIMTKWWGREVLEGVDGWACRGGGLYDDQITKGGADESGEVEKSV